MKRTITEIKVTEEETESDASSSTPGEGIVTFLVILALCFGLHSLMSRRNQPVTIDQRGNQGTIVNEWEVAQ